VGSLCHHIKGEASGYIPSLLDLGPAIRVNLVMPEHHAHRAPVRRVVPYVPLGVGRPAEAIERSARQLGRPRNRETH
jgi:hypothetical protein